MPTCEQKVAAKVCEHSRIARNNFTRGIDRVIGLAHDLRQRLRRVTAPQGSEQLSKAEWVAKEREQINIHVSETNGQISDGEGIHEYDHHQAGMSSWRIAKEVTKLRCKFKALMQKRPSKKNSEPECVEQNEWDFAGVFTEIYEQSRTTLVTSAEDIWCFINKV